MAFDPYALPVPDLGLRCLRCGYNLAYLTQHRCPECGHAFDIDEHVPAGDFPTVIYNSGEVLLTPEISALLRDYQITYMQRTGPMEAVYTDSPLSGKCKLAVSRDNYFEVIDLLRRRDCGEEMPPVPSRSSSTEEWTCKACGEESPGNFDLCWNCGEETAPAL